MAMTWYKSTLFEIYSDDDNYAKATGKISELTIIYFDKASVIFEWIQEDGKEKAKPKDSNLTYSFKVGNRYFIYLPNVYDTADAFDSYE